MGCWGSRFLAGRMSLGSLEARPLLEGQLLHQQVDAGIHLEAVQVVGVSLQPHQQPPVGGVGRAGAGREERRGVKGMGTRRSCSPTPRCLPPKAPGTHRRVAASMEVSSPSMRYTLPYITYSNWSALQQDGGSSEQRQNPKSSSTYPPGGRPLLPQPPSPGTWRAGRPWGCTRRRPACRPRTGCWQSPGGICHL